MQCEILPLDKPSFASVTQTHIYVLSFTSKQLPEPVGKPVTKQALSCNLMGKVLRPWQSMDNIFRAWIPAHSFRCSDQFTKIMSTGHLGAFPGLLTLIMVAYQLLHRWVLPLLVISHHPDKP